MYQYGDLIHILPYEKMGRQEHVNSDGKMSPWYDTIATVVLVDKSARTVQIKEDNLEWYWHFRNIEPYYNACILDEKSLMSIL